MIILGLEQGFKPSPIFNLHVFYSYFISGSINQQSAILTLF